MCRDRWKEERRRKSGNNLSDRLGRPSEPDASKKSAKRVSRVKERTKSQSDANRRGKGERADWEKEASEWRSGEEARR